RCRRNEPAGPSVVGLVGAHDRILTIDILPGNTTPRDNMVAAPSVIRAIAVCRQRAPEVGCSEERYLAAQAGIDHKLIEVLETGAQLAEQRRKSLGLRIVSIEPTQLYKKYLAA